MSTCRSCGAEIEWVRTPRGVSMPLDLERSPTGNLAVVDGVAVAVPAGEGDRISHFATCNDPKKWRKP